MLAGIKFWWLVSHPVTFTSNAYPPLPSVMVQIKVFMLFTVWNAM